MGGSNGRSKSEVADSNPGFLDERAKQVILFELERILDSQQFRSSKRSREFLSYVVHTSLDGCFENLKERIIGAKVYNREIDYATGDDPVVRINAGEVRRRLEQYYFAAIETPVRIEIPRGSYSPEFYWTATVAPEQNPHPSATQDTHESALADLEEPSAAKPKKSRSVSWYLAASCLALISVILLIVFGGRHQQGVGSAADLFWGPAFNTSRPVLICLAKSVAYRPSMGLYHEYALSHPGQLQSEVERENKELPLDPNDKIKWKDIQVYPDLGVGAGDVYAAVSISTFLTQKGRSSQVRVGSNFSFEDLRSSPSVVIGAYNNRWTMEMASNLHFAFQWQPPVETFPHIKENMPLGRVWASEVKPNFQYVVDYGVVTRLLDSNTGQLLISTAGLGPAGTQAAGELVSHPQELELALERAPTGWSKKNLQILVQTNVIDSIPGSPHVIATYFW
jgi:hypothetical protein